MEHLITKYYGLVPYEKSMELQRKVHGSVTKGAPDHLLLFQHNHVFTMGRTANSDDILIGASVLKKLGIAVHITDRGGEVTYHGPGQLIGYPILNLRRHKLGPLNYLEILKNSLSMILTNNGIKSKSQDLPTGIWVGNSKIASIGIKVSRGVTLHGFALNVNTDLDYFNYIVPCGMPNAESTSMEKELGHSLCLKKIADVTTRYLAKSLRLNAVPSDIKKME